MKPLWMLPLAGWSWILLFAMPAAAMEAADSSWILVDPRAPVLVSPSPPAEDGWLGLACEASGCALVSARPTLLSSEPTAWPLPAGLQHALRFEAGDQGEVLAWLRSDPTPGWLVPGEVVTHHAHGASEPPARPPGDGDFEFLLPDAAAGTARLIPVYEPVDDGSGLERIRLRLRVGATWQWLGLMRVCPGQLSRAYLRFAGDLDGDGTTDWLIDFAAGGAPRLFLSGAAGPGQLVGEVARSVGGGEPRCR